MLDRLPAWVRHLVIVFGAVALGTFAQSVVDASGVSHLDWTGSAAQAGDAGAVAVAAAALVLWLTPATRQYGVGSGGGDDGDLGNP